MKVEIWSDVVCPWCYIGKRRFEKALQGFEHAGQVEVHWRSFELDPEAPTARTGSLDEMLAAKYGTTLAQAQAMNENVTRLAAAEGVEFRLGEARPGNTFDAHRLIHLAAADGLQQEAKERLLRAYFSEGRAIGDRETLLQLAAEIGIDPETAREVLEGDAYAEEVRTDERRAHQLGANGVPFFVFDGRYGVSGAQPVETFERVLKRVWAECRPVTMLKAEAAAGADCDDGACRTETVASTGSGGARGSGGANSD